MKCLGNCRKLSIIRLGVVKVVDLHRQRHPQLAHKSGSLERRIQREDEVMHLLLTSLTAAGTLMVCHLDNGPFRLRPWNVCGSK